MATQPIGTSSANQSTLAPAQANGADQQVTQTQAGIAGNGQSTIAPAQPLPSVGQSPREIITNVLGGPPGLIAPMDPRMGATDGPIGSYGLTGQDREEVPPPRPNPAGGADQFLSPLSISGQLVVMFAFANERSGLPFPTVENAIPNLSAAQIQLLDVLRRQAQAEARLRELLASNRQQKTQQPATDQKKN